jgi:hypothetical protein
MLINLPFNYLYVACLFGFFTLHVNVELSLLWFIRLVILKNYIITNQLVVGEARVLRGKNTHLQIFPTIGSS